MENLIMLMIKPFKGLG